MNILINIETKITIKPTPKGSRAPSSFPVLHSCEDVSTGARRGRRAERSKTKGKTAQRPEPFLWLVDVKKHRQYRFWLVYLVLLTIWTISTDYGWYFLLPRLLKGFVLTQ